MFRALILTFAAAASPVAIKGGRTMKITRALGVVVAGVAAAASVSLAGGAQAELLEKTTFHEEVTDVAKGPTPPSRTDRCWRLDTCSGSPTPPAPTPISAPST
jgi:hypothetical protein